MRAVDAWTGDAAVGGRSGGEVMAAGTRSDVGSGIAGNSTSIRLVRAPVVHELRHDAN